MMGKHTTYLVSGPLRSLPNIQQFLEGKDNVGRENCMSIIGDEYEDSGYLEALIRASAQRLASAADTNYQKSVNFLGMGLAFKFKSVRLQAYERMLDMYIQLHKEIVDSGEQ